jgi:hypothetical protein
MDVNVWSRYHPSMVLWSLSNEILWPHSVESSSYWHAFKDYNMKSALIYFHSVKETGLIFSFSMYRGLIVYRNYLLLFLYSVVSLQVYVFTIIIRRHIQFSRKWTYCTAYPLFFRLYYLVMCYTFFFILKQDNTTPPPKKKQGIRCTAN